MKKMLNLSILTLLAAIPAAYAQTETFDWSETGSSLYGDASGTLTISVPAPYDDGAYNADVTAISGSFSTGPYAGDTITDTSPWSNLNQLYFTAATPSSGSQLTGTGWFSFDADSIPFIIQGFSGYGYQIFGYPDGSYTPDSGGDTFTLSGGVSPVPESPLNPGLVAAAGLLIGWRSWRGCQKVKAEH